MNGIIIAILWTIVGAIAVTGLIAVVKDVRRVKRERTEVLNSLDGDSHAAQQVASITMMTNLGGGGSQS